MQPLQFLIPIEQIDAIGPALPFAALVLVLANIVTRYLGHRSNREQLANDEPITRYAPHTATTALLILTSFAYVLVEAHGGIILSMFVIGMFMADFFEFEARQVEARNDLAFEAPKSAIAASVFAFLYAAYQSLFFLVADYWGAVV
ncbi:DUF7313 family protein [Halegenticoccus tardaugens]|uniref:DUF7313 family protein n=1 Tax=Halegenticoccus tardaugens TaxID=2071624 RepID=UPI00100BF4A1|nr:hypothetical protein [Halegenticoccus tardaugens]